MPCNKLHRQKVLKLKLFFYEILRVEYGLSMLACPPQA